MFKIPIENIIERIKNEKGLSDAEINQMIEKKIEQLSGLVSREGAAHIVANELGVKLFEPVEGRIQIKNVLVGMRRVEVAGKVLQLGAAREFETPDGKQGKVGSLMIGDESDVIRVVLWGSVADKLNEISEGDLIKIENGYVRERNGRKEIHLSDKGNIIINPSDIEIGEVKLPTPEQKKIIELNEGDLNVEIVGTIIQVFDPTFYEVCPVCGKRIKKVEGSEGTSAEGFKCNKHGLFKEPSFAYVLNIFIDDGSDIIRCVLFRENATALIGEDVMSYKNGSFDGVKMRLIGTQVKLRGRVVKNLLFDRLEFIVNEVEKKDLSTAEESIAEEEKVE